MTAPCGRLGAARPGVGALTAAPAITIASTRSGRDALAWAGYRGPTDLAFAATVGELLRGSSASVPVGDITPRVRARLEQLRADDIVELKRGRYRATYIALYSSYRLPPPPIPALTNEWDDPLTSRGKPCRTSVD
jgi:hypothetical protein